jgi:hypothetical protein
MNPVTVSLAVGVLVVLGKWSRDQSPNIDNAIGVAGVAIGLALLDQIDGRLSKAFGTLILVSVAVVHLPEIAKKAGLVK